MNGILGMAQVLQMPGITEAERLDSARTILGSGQTLLTLLNDILDLSKIEAGKVELEAIALEPAQVIGEAQALFAELACGKGVRIETDWSGAPGHYLGDPHRVRQMLSNLVGNAVKFTDQGQIRIEAREVGGDGQTALLEFSVSDTGIGIAEGDQALLFQPFSQADSSITRRYGGSGLGLSLVATLARLMGGEAGVDSEVGRGSRFWFRIRAERVAADRPVPPLPDAGAGSGAATHLSGRVLVVEDDPGNRKVVEIMLRKLGLDTVVAADGQHALDALAGGEAADLILMDVQMPRLDGYATTEAIRRREEETGAPRRPIIALTANAFAEDRRRCLTVGMDGVLTKPVMFAALKAELAKWLPAADAGDTDAVEAPAVADQPLDGARVAALVEELLPLLAQHMFSARGRFRALQDAVAGTAMAAEINETGQLLEGLHFDLALERLRHLAMTHQLDTTT
jgi:CheY-like chemotaxis protein